jgi:hypothetical protein
MEAKMVEEKRDASLGVMKLYEHEDMIVYQLACNCGSKDCITEFTFDVDPDGLFVELSIEKKLLWFAKSDINEFIEPSFFKRHFIRRMEVLWERIKGACKILFKGYIEVNGQVLMRDDQHIINLITCLQISREKMNTRMEEYKQKYEKEKNQKG